MMSNISSRRLLRFKGWAAHLLLPCSLLLLSTAAAAVPAPQGPGAAEPAIVARVNGEPITRDEWQRQLTDPLTTRQLQQETGGRDSDPVDLERLAMRELIRRHLLLQEARRRNFTVTGDELDQALLALRRRFGDIDSFGAWMHERGLDDRSLMDALRDGLLTNRVMAALVQEVRVPEEEIRRYYEAHQADLTIGEEVRLRLIAVRDEAAAEEILDALRRGEDFRKLAQQRSIGQRAAQGGDTGWLDARTLPPMMKEAVDALKPGDVGGPVRKAADEFLLVGLEGRRPLRATSLGEAQSEIERRLLPARQREAIESWLTEQERTSTIEVLLQTR